MPRFYLPQLPSIGTEISLPETVFHHAVRVLRLRVGDTLAVFDGEGREGLVELRHVQKQQATGQLLSLVEHSRESPLSLHLVQGLCSAEKMDWIIEKAVELGVQSITPLLTEKSTLRIDGERALRKRQHWQDIMVSACGQCGRNQLPQLQPITRFSDWVAAPASGWLTANESSQANRILVLSPRATTRLSALQLIPTQTISLVVGPEGGLSPQEEAQLLAAPLRASGCLPEAIQLGPRILRTETAGLAVLAALQVSLGDC
ncbi:16S rRNA (uracil(1498)-N(3))-methyltransferase [Parvibium lacunae]|uniref:Ribosomal RNA small subunit methyltransferase E n=1 Tax=Parvibium lacunae TaxID=1888893 RepID=A0A368L1B6_9BURK|nr:16S rRNA (uracil(1498)-N(3))-methyltransferase [Parvibium lacunae]RCS57345.1 16S rRNA (uracil(1498)-N(3))-methyltransferase [Parvibium lacunae]